MSHTLLARAAAIAVALGLAATAATAAPASAAGHHGRPCFIVQAHWNTALDGPQPRC